MPLGPLPSFSHIFVGSKRLFALRLVEVAEAVAAVGGGRRTAQPYFADSIVDSQDKK